MRNKDRDKEKKTPTKTKEKKKTSALSEIHAKKLEVLAMREKYHRFEQLMRWGQQDLDEQFGVWSPPPRTPDELRELFFRMFGDLR